MHTVSCSLLLSQATHLAAVVLAQRVKPVELVDVVVLVIRSGDRERGRRGRPSGRPGGGSGWGALVARVGEHLLLLLLARLAEDLGAEGGRDGRLLIRLVLLGGARAAALRSGGDRVGIRAERQAMLRLLLGACCAGRAAAREALNLVAAMDALRRAPMDGA